MFQAKGKLLAMAGVVVVGTFGASAPTSAITAELAKKCRAAAVKAHPVPRGAKTTDAARAQQAYFRACLAKGGKAD